MTEGEKQAKRIELQLKWIRYVALPGAFAASAIAYVFVVESVGFAAMVLALTLVAGIDEYRQRSRIFNSEARMTELKAIESKRSAAVYVNGGFGRDLKHFVLIGIAVLAWVYFAG